MLEATFCVLLSVAAGWAPPQDSVKALARRAQSAAFHYETLLRRLAPERSGGGGGQHCDEIVGRFCFTYDAPGASGPGPEADPERTVRARIAALQAHRRWFSAAPENPLAAGRVVRYLIEDERRSEAVSAARAHAWAAGRNPASLMLLGLALHESGDFAAAEAAFDSARDGMDPKEREKLDDIKVLLESEDRKAYGRMTPRERAVFEERFWAFSDPSLLEPGNERRSAHYARRAWASILAKAPHALGMVRWGSDQAEILLRFGRPVRRERERQYSPTLEPKLSMVEMFDPHAVTFVPPHLATEGIPFPDPPGRRPDLERDTARSQYAPLRLHRMHALVFQSSVFPGGAPLLRIDAMLPPDMATPRLPVRPRGLVALLDTMGVEVARAEAEVRVDPIRGTFLIGELPVSPGAYVARAEVADESAKLGGLAQFRVDVPAGPTLSVSDLVIAAPFPADAAPAGREDEGLFPLPSLVVPPGQPLGLYAEVNGLQRAGDESRYAVAWQVESVDETGAVGRAARWLGRRLGLVGPPKAPIRVEWEGASVENPAVLAFTLDLSGAGEGLKRVSVTVTDQVTGDVATTTRLVRVEEGAAGPPVPSHR